MCYLEKTREVDASPLHRRKAYEGTMKTTLYTIVYRDLSPRSVFQSSQQQKDWNKRKVVNAYNTVRLLYEYNTVRIYALDNTIYYWPKMDRIGTVYCRKCPVLATITVHFRIVNDAIVVDLGCFKCYILLLSISF